MGIDAPIPAAAFVEPSLGAGRLFSRREVEECQV
jgi:hypothetical protein